MGHQGAREAQTEARPRLLEHGAEQPLDAPVGDDRDTVGGAQHGDGARDILVEAPEPNRWVQRDGHGAGELNAEEGIHEGLTGREHERHPLAGLDAQRGEVCRRRQGSLMDGREVDPLLTLAAIDEDEAPERARRRVGERLGQGRRRRVWPHGHGSGSSRRAAMTSRRSRTVTMPASSSSSMITRK